MSISSNTPHDNLTLSEADLAACRPIVGEGGHVLRALCPFHGSDRQRSLRVQVHSGRFVCFACGAWGYMETARTHWREEQQRQAAFRRSPARRQRLPRPRQREHGDAGGYAATGISSTSRSMSGYQRLKMALSSPFSVRTRVCNNKCAPSLDHCICCFLQKRLLTTSFTVDSTNPVAIGSPLRYLSP